MQPYVEINSPYSNRIQLVLGDWIGPLTRPTSPPTPFNPMTDLEIYINGKVTSVTSWSFDSINNRYLLFTGVTIDQSGVIQVIHHMPSPPFRYVLYAPANLAQETVGYVILNGISNPSPNALFSFTAPNEIGNTILILVGFHSYNDVVTYISITDTNGNSYSKIVASVIGSPSSSDHLELWGAFNVGKGSNSVTIDAHATNYYIGLGWCAMEYRNIVSPTSSYAASSGYGSSPLNTGAVTPSGVYISGWRNRTSAPISGPSPSTGWSLDSFEHSSPADWLALASSVTQPGGCTWTWGGGQGNSAIIAAFNPKL